MKIIHNNETITGENIYSCEISEYCDLISNEIASNTLTVKLKVPVEKVFKKKDQIVCVDNNDNIMGYFYIETAKLVDYISYDKETFLDGSNYREEGNQYLKRIIETYLID